LPPKLPKIGVGAIGAGAGFGAGFFATVLFFAGVALFIPFFLRAGAPRFAFLDFFAFAFRFFAIISLPIGSTNTLYINPRREPVRDCSRDRDITRRAFARRSRACCRGFLVLWCYWDVQICCGEVAIILNAMSRATRSIDNSLGMIPKEQFNAAVNLHTLAPCASDGGLRTYL
jgi:hypothetical protein